MTLARGMYLSQVVFISVPINWFILRFDIKQLPAKEKRTLGKRCLIICFSASNHPEYSQRMWFELQREGLEGVYCTTRFPFPLVDSISENAAFFRRAGCSSIIAIGDGSVSDHSKALRKELLANSTQEHIPLINIATTISSVYNSGLCGILHEEEDIINMSKCANPEVRHSFFLSFPIIQWIPIRQIVIFDPTIIIGSPSHFNPRLSALYLLSDLFDTLFERHLEGGVALSIDDVSSLSQLIRISLMGSMDLSNMKKAGPLVFKEGMLASAPTPSSRCASNTIGSKY